MESSPSGKRGFVPIVVHYREVESHISVKVRTEWLQSRPRESSFVVYLPIFSLDGEPHSFGLAKLRSGPDPPEGFRAALG